MGYILALIGMGLMVGLSGAGSAIGLVLGGSSVLGMVKKKPDAFGSGMILSGMPATQGLYGFVAFIMYSGLVTPESYTVPGISSFRRRNSGFPRLFHFCYLSRNCLL